MLLDSNILIYAVQPDFQGLRNWLMSQSVCVSAITCLEVLGYHKLTETDKCDFNQLFACIETLSISKEVVECAIGLRQLRKMSLGDAIIAATALIDRKTLVTRNVKDFEWIDGLNVLNPVGNGGF